MWAILTGLLLPALVTDPDPAAPGLLRYALHDPFLVWESSQTIWMAADGASVRPLRVAEPLGPRLEGPGGVGAMLAVVPPEGRLTLAARSGEVLVVDGPSTVRFHAEAGRVHALVRDALATRGGAQGTARALDVPEGWHEGPWPALDAAGCPDFRPPWGRWVPPLGLGDAARTRPTSPSDWLLPLATGDRALPTRTRRAPREALTLAWSQEVTPSGAVAITVTSELDGAVVEQWQGLSGDRVTLVAPFWPGAAYRVAVNAWSREDLGASLAFEVLATDDEATLETALGALSGLAARLGDPAVAVLEARLLETWGLDEEARDTWWRLYLAQEGHPQALAILARAFAAPY